MKNYWEKREKKRKGIIGGNDLLKRIVANRAVGKKRGEENVLPTENSKTIEDARAAIRTGQRGGSKTTCSYNGLRELEGGDPPDKGILEEREKGKVEKKNPFKAELLNSKQKGRGENPLT